MVETVYLGYINYIGVFVFIDGTKTIHTFELYSIRRVRLSSLYRHALNGPPSPTLRIHSQKATGPRRHRHSPYAQACGWRFGARRPAVLSVSAAVSRCRGDNVLINSRVCTAPWTYRRLGPAVTRLRRRQTFELGTPSSIAVPDVPETGRFNVRILNCAGTKREEKNNKRLGRTRSTTIHNRFARSVSKTIQKQK